MHSWNMNFLLHYHKQSNGNHFLTFSKNKIKLQDRNLAICSPDGQPLEPPCVIHLHIRSLYMGVEARAICRCLITSKADGAEQWRSQERLPTFRSVLSDKDWGGIWKQRPSLYGWCFKSSESADEEWRSGDETVSSAAKFLICLRIPVLRQSTAQLIIGTDPPFPINSGTT